MVSPYAIVQTAARSTRPIEFRGEWGYNQLIWTLELACTVDLTHDYTPSGPNTGFYIRLNLEPQATMDIRVSHIRLELLNHHHHNLLLLPLLLLLLDNYHRRLKFSPRNMYNHKHDELVSMFGIVM